MDIDTVIVAGGLNEGQLKELSPEKYEALIKIGGKPMVEYVVRETVNAQNTENIIVVGPKEISDVLSGEVLQRIELVDNGGSLLDNVQKGINNLGSSGYVLLMTSDIPLIRSEMVDYFINRCKEKAKNADYDIFYPLISQQSSLEKYPGAVRTTFRLKEGVFTGGNLIIIRREILPSLLSILKEVIAWRKKPWKLVSFLGLGYFLKYLIGRLSIKNIETKARGITGFSLKGLIVTYPEIGFDIDKQVDLKYINQYFDHHREKTD